MMITALTLAVVGASGPLTKFSAYDSLRSIAVAPGTGSRYAVSTEDNTVRIMDAATGKTLRTLKGHPQPAYGLAFNANGTVLASGDESGRIYLWNAASGAKTKEFSRVQAHSRGIQALNFSADGKYLASTGKDDVILIWDIASGKIIRRVLGEGANVSSMTFGKGVMFTATLGEGLKVYKGLGDTLLTRLDGHRKQGTVDFKADLKFTRGVTGGRDGSVAFWSLAKRTLMTRAAAHDDVVINVAMSPDGKYGASSSLDRTVALWNPVNGKRMGTLEDQSAVGAPICFTNDGKFLVSSSVSDALTVYKIK